MPFLASTSNSMNWASLKGDLGGALDLDDAALVGQHEIGIGLGLGVFRVVEVEHGGAFPQAAGHGGDLAGQRVGGHLAVLDQTLEGAMQRHPGAGDAGGAGAAIGLQDVAVDVDLALAHGRQIDHGAQRPADQALDLLGAARLLAARGFTVRAGMGRARQHAVFGRHPAAARIAQERWHFLVDRGGAENMGIAEFDQAGALGVAGEARFEADGAKLVGGAAGRAHEGLLRLA